MEEQENTKEENVHLRRFLIILANVLVLACLGGSGYLIYFVVQRSQEFKKLDNPSWYQNNEVMCNQHSKINCLFKCVSPKCIFAGGAHGIHSLEGSLETNSHLVNMFFYMNADIQKNC